MCFGGNPGVFTGDPNQRAEAAAKAQKEEDDRIAAEAAETQKELEIENSAKLKSELQAALTQGAITKRRRRGQNSLNLSLGGGGFSRSQSGPRLRGASLLGL